MESSKKQHQRTILELYIVRNRATDKLAVVNKKILKKLQEKGQVEVVAAFHYDSNKYRDSHSDPAHALAAAMFRAGIRWKEKNPDEKISS